MPGAASSFEAIAVLKTGQVVLPRDFRFPHPFLMTTGDVAEKDMSQAFQQLGCLL